jgi:Helix-turn-helix domain
MRVSDSHSDNIVPRSPTVDAISDDTAAERADQSNSALGGRSKRKPSTGGIGSLQVRALRVNDAAKIYGISRSTLYKMMALFDRGVRSAGGLPALRYVQLGGHRLIPVDALEALISEDAI